MNTGTCPKCSKVLTALEVEDITLNVTYNPQWKGFSYCCPYCRTIVGVQLNPLALEVDLVEKIAERLGR